MKIVKILGFYDSRCWKIGYHPSPCCTFWNITVLSLYWGWTLFASLRGKENQKEKTIPLSLRISHIKIWVVKVICLLMTMLLTQYRFFWDQLDKTQTSKLCWINRAVTKLQKWVQNCIVLFIYLLEMDKMKTMSLFSATHMI